MRGIKKIVAVALALCCVVGCMGCKKDWWEDRTKIDVVFSAENGTPDTLTVNIADIEAKKDIHFTYQYDGEEHIPQAKIMVEGEEQGYIWITEKKYYLEEEGWYNPIRHVKHPGKYLLSYYLFKEYKPYDTDYTIKRDYISVLRVNIEIQK